MPVAWRAGAERPGPARLGPQPSIYSVAPPAPAPQLWSATAAARHTHVHVHVHGHRHRHRPTTRTGADVCARRRHRRQPMALLRL